MCHLYLNFFNMLINYLLFISLIHSVIGNYFCKLKCGKEHTVCKRKPCSVSKGCGNNAASVPLNDKERQYILDVHNKLRNKVAMGKDKQGGNSEASNMIALSYNKELEFVAQCWSNGCREGGISHDTCRDTKKFQYAGQNMFAMGSSIKMNLRDLNLLNQAVASWYKEIKACNAAEIDAYKGKTKTPIGHFTQVVWAETTHIGCGRTSFSGGMGPYSVYIYCNYGIGGNLEGAPVYKRGRHCSACGKLECNSQYRGLCGTIEKLSDDKWKPPFAIAGGEASGSDSGDQDTPSDETKLKHTPRKIIFYRSDGVHLKKERWLVSSLTNNTKISRGHLKMLLRILQFLWSRVLIIYIYSCHLKDFYGQCIEEDMRECLFSYKCIGNYTEFHLNDRERQWIVDTHNQYRDKIALGYVTTGGNGKASNMHVISYSKELEEIAQCQANMCTQKNFHKKCNGSNLGRNMLDLDKIDSRFKSNYWLLSAITTWYSEISNTEESILNKYATTIRPTAHFTQMVWAETTQVGCGRTQFKSKTKYCILLECLYKAAGNVIGEPVYKRGQPCSECGFEKCNDQYKGLCGKIRPLSENIRQLPGLL
ncbi:hypothetical protein ILUMI_03931 [Ignelater luminosus]|uniref:SCP domain-containing protein n=1 Tax=Ignelater luminosus TaxID=2038154 RepID=A0A8K0DFB4_IGNLU|nr:hypothetical protein ILUMI_03931 [Ignelater luminosus]